MKALYVYLYDARLIEGTVLSLLNINGEAENGFLNCLGSSERISPGSLIPTCVLITIYERVQTPKKSLVEG